MDNATTDDEGKITYDGVHDDSHAYLELIAPKGYKLDLQLHTLNRTVDYGGTEYVNIVDEEIPNIPVTGGKGIIGYIIAGVLISTISITIIVLHNKKKRGDN